MTRIVRIETFNGNVITGSHGGIQRIQIRGVTKVCRVVGEQYVSIDNISVAEFQGDNDAWLV
jgi:hypothetical protein